MTRLRTVLGAIRRFARGFLGLATPISRDPAAARAQLQDAAERRPRCC